MELKKLFLLFLRSPLAVGIVSLNAVLAMFSILLISIPSFIVVPSFLIISGIALAVVFSSAGGVKALIAEKDREQLEHDSMKLEQCKQARKALIMIRTKSSIIKTAIDKLSFSAGQYLESCAKGGQRDPLAEDAILSAKEAVMLYQKSLDDKKITMMTESKSESETAQLNFVSEKEIAEYLNSLTNDIENRITPINLDFQNKVLAHKELDK